MFGTLGHLHKKLISSFFRRVSIKKRKKKKEILTYLCFVGFKVYRWTHQLWRARDRWLGQALYNEHLEWLLLTRRAERWTQVFRVGDLSPASSHIWSWGNVLKHSLISFTEKRNKFAVGDKTSFGILWSLFCFVCLFFPSSISSLLQTSESV